VQNQSSDEKALLTKLYQEVAGFYTKALWSPEGEKARKYILER